MSGGPAEPAAFLGGEPLPDGLLRRLERGFATDLGSVRVHDDRAAPAAAQEARASAFTSGTHIFFGRGQYVPASATGSRLVAHEVAHVVQQMWAGVPRVDRHAAADHRLPATLAEALALSSSAKTAIDAVLATLSTSADPRVNNIPALMTALAVSVGPLTPRHDSAVGSADINFITGTTNYVRSTVLPQTSTHWLDPGGAQVWFRARGHIDVDSILLQTDVTQRVVDAVSELADLRSRRGGLGGVTAVELYRARFNALYVEPPHNTKSDNFDPSMGSRGPKSAHARSVFTATLARYPSLATAYNNNVGGSASRSTATTVPKGSTS